jgi:hypothetical protein
MFLVVSGILFFLPTVACFCFGLLGLSGVLADVGPMENQAFGLKLIGIGVGCGMVSLVLFLLLIWVRTPRSEPD